MKEELKILYNLAKSNSLAINYRKTKCNFFKGPILEGVELWLSPGKVCWSHFGPETTGKGKWRKNLNNYKIQRGKPTYEDLLLQLNVGYTKMFLFPKSTSLFANYMAFV